MRELFQICKDAYRQTADSFFVDCMSTCKEQRTLSRRAWCSTGGDIGVSSAYKLRCLAPAEGPLPSLALAQTARSAAPSRARWCTTAIECAPRATCYTTPRFVLYTGTCTSVRSLRAPYAA